MESEILSELAKGPKTLEEISFRTSITSYEALHHLQQLKMQEKIKAIFTPTGEVWSLA